jgi:hypothetical protein
MRFGPILWVLLALTWATSAGANTINYGAVNDSATSCSQSGDAADRSCTRASTVTNGASDTTASVNLRGQASADHGITTNPTAIVDMTMVFDIPYTVTRTVTIQDGPPFPVNASVPLQSISFNITFQGDVAKDNSQVGGGLGQASSFNATLQSLNGFFTTQNYATAASQTGGGGLASTDVNVTVPDPSYAAGINFSGAAVGEINTLAQVPTNYRMWTDDVAPGAFNYGAGPHSHQQSITDTLRLTFRLRAESRPSGSVSTTGGEAIACFGQTSPLGGFDLDNNAAVNCGSGITIAALVTQTGSTLVQVPEPSTLILLGSALAGLAWAGSRGRARG